MRHSFTLLEVLLVLVVVGIIATFAAPGYWGARQRALNNMTQSMLRLIHSAERTHQLEEGDYAECADTAACNIALNLELPTDPSAHWIYSVTVNNAATPQTFTARAGHGTPAQGWQITQAGVISSY